MEEHVHPADNLKSSKKVVFTAQSKHNFHNRMLICKHAFEEGVIPLNPFNMFGYYLYELVPRDSVRNANNNVLEKCDEVWVYGVISDGVLSEIKTAKQLGKPVKYFDISKLPNEIIEISKEDAELEDDISSFRGFL